MSLMGLAVLQSRRDRFFRLCFSKPGTDALRFLRGDDGHAVFSVVTIWLLKK